MAKDLAETPDDPNGLTLLGIIDAGLGNKADALAEGRRACELRPVSQGAFSAWVALKNLAQIEAWTGEKAAVVEHLGSLCMTHCFYYNYGLLKLGPIWDDLRGDPGFEALLVSLAPKDWGRTGDLRVCANSVGTAQRTKTCSSTCSPCNRLPVPKEWWSAAAACLQTRVLQTEAFET